METIAEGVFLLNGFPRYAINVYLAGDVLIDAGTRMAEGRIMRQIAGRKVAAHALTHAHPDHQGSSHAICAALDIPLWCGAGDRAAAESGDLSEIIPPHWLNSLQAGFWTGPGHPVARVLREGDEVAGFTVLETPGHSPGHISLWRESDRVLILGDVLNGMNLLTTMPGLHEPPVIFTCDPALNRNSAKRLGRLEPAVVCFGHGPPWRDTRSFARFCAALAD
jgi:glyoxylase-like metal-dependent hydrolase (beta-lactamase superfamily II)